MIAHAFGSPAPRKRPGLTGSKRKQKDDDIEKEGDDDGGGVGDDDGEKEGDDDGRGVGDDDGGGGGDDDGVGGGDDVVVKDVVSGENSDDEGEEDSVETSSGGVHSGTGLKGSQLGDSGFTFGKRTENVILLQKTPDLSQVSSGAASAFHLSQGLLPETPTAEQLDELLKSSRLFADGERLSRLKKDDETKGNKIDPEFSR